MRTSTRREYNKELQDYFNALEIRNPDIIEGLAVKDDFEGFVMEMAMLGLQTLKKQEAKK